MSKRSKAREVALQVLYHDDLNADGEPLDRTGFVLSRLHQDQENAAFCQSLIDGVRRNRGELDSLLEKTAENWSLARMASTDRNVMRLGAYELLYTSTPPAAAINEAVELARRFGSAQSAQFVNGILDKFIAGHRKE